MRCLPYYEHLCGFPHDAGKHRFQSRVGCHYLPAHGDTWTHCTRTILQRSQPPRTCHFSPPKDFGYKRSRFSPCSSNDHDLSHNTRGASGHPPAFFYLDSLLTTRGPQEQLGHMQAFEIHRKNVSLLVQQCGGIDAFEDGGAIKGTLLQCVHLLVHVIRFTLI